MLDLYAEEFRAAMSLRRARAPTTATGRSLDPIVERHAAIVKHADALVFVYPTWWSMMPAILKGWLERVMVPGVGFVFDENGHVRRGLINVHRVIGISTYGASSALREGDQRQLAAHVAPGPAAQHRRARTAVVAGAVQDGRTNPDDRAGSCGGSNGRCARCEGLRRLLPSRPRVVHGGGASRAVEVLHAAGHEVRVADLYAEGFEPAMSLEEVADHLGPPEHKTAVAPYCDDLQWCDTLVFIYPTWWSGQPAMLKGWLDRVLIRGVAWDLPDGATRIAGRLTNVRRLVAITTHGSSTADQHAGGRDRTKGDRQGAFGCCAIRTARATWLAMYGIDRSTAARREEFLDHVGRRARRAVTVDDRCRVVRTP